MFTLHYVLSLSMRIDKISSVNDQIMKNYEQ